MKGIIKKLYGKEQKDERINNVTNRKNMILFELANSRNLRWLDINSSVNNKHFNHIDHIHFEEKAKSFIAKEMLNVLNQ